MSQTQLEVLGRHSATQIIKTLEHLETRQKKTLAEEKKIQGKIRRTGTQLIHKEYCEGTK